MNILILNWKDIRHPQVGGAEIIVYELAKRLARDGHQVTWFCRRFPYAPRDEVIDGIKIVRRGSLLTMYLAAPLYYWRLAKKPQLVIDVSNTIYWQTPLWAWRSRQVAYLNQLAQDIFYYEYPLIISRLGMVIERWQYLTYRHTPFVCYSPSTRADLVAVGIPRANVHTFALGLDHRRYFPGPKSATPLFICVNRLVKMKRTDLVIRAMSEVKRAYPRAKLVIVGTGYDRPRLERLRDSLALQSTVRFADEKVWFFSPHPQDAKVKLMQQAWALVFPSVKEGWGMTVTECAACGTLAIVSDVSGLRDSVVGNKTGLVVSANPAPAELASAMISVIAQPWLRQRLARAARDRASQFDWERSYRQFVRIISSAL